MLNGRNTVANNFTFIAQGGASVVDYCIIPYEELTNYENFEVHCIRVLIQLIIGVNTLNSVSFPDHSILTWNCSISTCDANENPESQPSFTVYDRKNIPDYFLSDESLVSQLSSTIEKLQSEQLTQDSLDNAYGHFCTLLKNEMDRCLNPKVITLGSTTQRKKRRTKKPWWSDTLTNMWNEMCVEEKKWLRSTGNERKLQRNRFIEKRKLFDKQV